MQFGIHVTMCASNYMYMQIGVHAILSLSINSIPIGASVSSLARFFFEWHFPLGEAYSQQVDFFLVLVLVLLLVRIFNGMKMTLHAHLPK